MCLNDDPELTLTSFAARSNLVLFVFVWGNKKLLSLKPNFMCTQVLPNLFK